MSILRYSAAWLAGACVSVFGTAGAQTARGTVTDTSGMRIPDAEVRFMSPNGNTTVVVSPVTPGGITFSISAPPPDGRYVIYYLIACADGYAPQIVGAPYGRGDTLQVRFELARTTVRPQIMSLGSGACNWQQDRVVRSTIKHTGTFPSVAALTAAEINNLSATMPRDSASQRAYVNRLIARDDIALQRARTTDDRQRAAYKMTTVLGYYERPDAPQLRARVVAALPPTSRWWLSQTAWVQWAVASLFDAPPSGDKSSTAQATRSKVRSYLQRMTLIGEPEIRSEARGELIRYTAAAGDSADAQLLVTQLLKDQPNYMWSKLVAAHYSNSRLLRTGNRFPVFSLPPLPDTSGKRITNSVLHARFTLVDFWGTWCGPCIRELPVLAKLYSAYHATGLEILSIAADAEPATVNDFRRTKYPMPWLNALGGATDAPALQHLGVVGYPTAVLVDSAGMIVASGNALSPDSLVSTVKRFMSRN